MRLVMLVIHGSSVGACVLFASQCSLQDWRCHVGAALRLAHEVSEAKWKSSIQKPELLNPEHQL